MLSLGYFQIKLIRLHLANHTVEILLIMFQLWILREPALKGIVCTVDFAGGQKLENKEI